MRLRNFEIFHAVMRTGSVSAAAESLHLSQSAASKALAQAEHALGLKLFERVRGRLVSTREAERLFAQTTQLFEQAEMVQRLASNLRRSPGGHLRIGCLPSLGIGLIPEAIKHYHRTCPEVSIDIATGNSSELIDRCLSQDIDLAIAFEQARQNRVKSLVLGTARAVHLEERASGSDPSPVRLADLDRRRWIGIGGSDPLAQKIQEAWNPATDEDSAPLPMPSLETRTYAVACALAAQGLGFALVDEFTAAAMGGDTVIRALSPQVSVGVVALQNVATGGSEALGLFIDAVRVRLKRGATHHPFEKE